MEFKHFQGLIKTAMNPERKMKEKVATRIIEINNETAVATRMALSRAHTSAKAADVTNLLLLNKCQ